MDEISHQSVLSTTSQALSVDSGPAELAEIVSVLEHSLETVEALGLSLLAALLDHAISEAKRQLID